MEMLNHIQLDEEGIPRTINGYVKVNMIEVKYRAGDSAEEIAEHYGITLADVHAALAYFYDHREYFEARRREVQPLIEDAKRYTNELKAKIQARMQQKNDE